jgi:glycerophosphoryl diester phosphodiesterase
VLFAHRGAGAHAAPDTLEAFRLAVRLGATGLATDAWVTADGAVALSADGSVGRIRRRSIGAMPRADLPETVPVLDDLYHAVGTTLPLAVGVRDPEVVAAAVETARRFDAADDLWLCHGELDVLAGWRAAHPDVRLVNATRLRNLDVSAERRLAELRDAGVDGLSLDRTDWNAGLVTLAHRFGRVAWGRGATHVRMVVELLHAGIDGVFSDHVDRMVDAAAAVGPA